MRDPGGRLGVPNAATASPKILDDHNERVEKLFCCLMNYIYHTCELYKESMREYNNDGVLLYHRVRAVGTVVIPQTVKDAYSDTWKRMEYDNSRIRYTFDGIFQWAEKVFAQGRILNKTADEMREKFVSGLPKFCDGFRTNMKKDTTCIYPATYGALPGLAGHPRAIQAHPMAGKSDISALAKSYFPDWCAAVTTHSKFTPDGFARVAFDTSNDTGYDFDTLPTELTNMLSSEVTPDTICTHCHKPGHAASQWLKNGMLLVCPNKVLSKEHPDTYTQNGGSAKQVIDLTKQLNITNEHVDLLQDQIASMEKEFASKLHQLKRSNRHRSRADTPPPTTYGTTSDESEHDYTMDHDDDEDSASSQVGPSDFADAAIQRKFKHIRESKFGKRPMASSKRQ
jgi:hypothetical protein